MTITNGNAIEPLVDTAGIAPGSPESTASVAPLGSEFDEISLDGTSITSNDSLRAEKPDELTEQDKERAKNIKSEANRLFSASDYSGSLDLYTLSLNINPFDPATWCNRAAVRLKREEFGLAIYDAGKALELDPRYVKAYYRRAVANLSVMKPKAALTDFKKVVALDPKNAAAQKQLDSTVKLVRKMDFEKAIASKDDEPISIRCKKQLQDELLDPKYDGPRLEEYTDEAGIKRARPTQAFLEGMIQHFKAEKLLPRKYVWYIVLGCQEELLKHESLVEVAIPEGHTCDVVGDTHGQFYDVLHLLELTGPPSETHSMVINGDFVDRGSFSAEVVLTWFAYKWLYPKHVFLNRGNHETKDMNSVYGFLGEIKKKYSEMTYKLFEECFVALPVATLVTASKPPKPRSDALPPPQHYTLGPNGTKRFFVVHGGLFSRDEIGLEDVRKVDRVKEGQPQAGTVFGEALWTDPQDLPGRGPSKRGVGLGFGPDVTKRWTEAQKVTAVIRSHEVRQEGWSMEHEGLCITVFSAPNYVDQVGNLAAFIRIADDGELSFTTFKAQPHPSIKPMQYAGGFAGLF